MTGLLLLVSLASAAPTPSVSQDAVSGTTAPGAWGIVAQGGYPWSAVRAFGGVHPRLTVFGEVDTALFRRIQPTVGLNVDLVSGAVGRLTAEVGLGWQFQWGELPQSGASAVVRIKGSVTGGRVTAFLHASTRHTLLADRTRWISEDGERVSWAFRHGWTPGGQLGLAVRITPMVGLEAGLGWRIGDVGTYAFSLPSFHGGIHIGGGR